MGSRAARWLERIVPIVPLAWLAMLFLVPLGFTVVFSFAHATFGGVELGFTLENFREALTGFYRQIFIRTIEFAALRHAALRDRRDAARLRARAQGGALQDAAAGPAAGAVLDELPDPHAVVADHPGAGRAPRRTSSTSCTCTTARSTSSTRRRPSSSASSTATCRWPRSRCTSRSSASAARCIEASKDLGGNRLRTFLHVTLPLARPGIATALLLTFVPMTGEFVIPSILGGDKGVLMGGLISGQYLEAANYPLGSAMAVLVLIVLGVAVALLVALHPRLRRGAVMRVLLGRRFGSWSDRGLALWSVAVFAFLFAPIVTAVVYSFNEGVFGKQTATVHRHDDVVVLGRPGTTRRCVRPSRPASAWRWRSP